MKVTFVGALLILVADISARQDLLPDGSILEVEDEYAAVRNSGDPKLRKKKMLKNPHLLWRKAVVIYKIDDAIGCPSSKKCLIIMKAMYSWMDKTCVRFKEWSGEADFVWIIESRLLGKHGGGDSRFGKVGGEQLVRVAPDSWYKDVLIHARHTLGLWDEHNHPDRDHYVDVRHRNIDPGHEYVFDKVDRENFNVLGVPFNPESIMMYAENNFSKRRSQTARYMIGNKPTLRSKWGHPLKRTSKISAGDIRRIQDLYRCLGTDQKPSFPVDVVCTFDHHDCGFKNLGGNWMWIPRTKYDGGYLQSALELDSKTSTKARTWSVHFYGLSHLDSKRGPDGCINFYHMSKTLGTGILSVRLVKVELRTPLDLAYSSKYASEIWSNEVRYDPENKPLMWYRVSTPVNVEKPFMLNFISTFVDGTYDDFAFIDGLEVRYDPCEYPTYTGADRKKPKLGWLKSMKSLLRLPSTASPSLSRSFSRRTTFNTPPNSN